MKIARGRVVTGALGAGTAGALGILRFPGGAAEFTYKMGSDEAMSHPQAQRLAQVADKITQDAAGRLEIKFFPNSALGGDTRMLAQLREGALEFQSTGDNILTTVVPMAAISTVPFAFPSYREAWSTMDGPLGGYLRAACARQNLHVFEKTWDAGMRQIANGLRPVTTPDDLKGMKIRVPAAPVTVALFKAFGTSPAAINANEEYTALQTHLVDGFEQPLIGIEAARLYEVSKYIAITNHMWTGYSVVANADAWNRLPTTLQNIVSKNFNTYAALERADIVRSDDTLTATLKGQGMIFNNADLGSFKAAIRKAGLYQTWRDSFGPEVWGLLEKSVGKLA